MKDIAELHRQEWKEFYAAYEKSKIDLAADEEITRMVKQYGNEKLPRYWLNKIEQNRESWNAEWGFGGRRYREMEQKQSVRLHPVPDFLNDAYSACDAEGKKLIDELGKHYQQEAYKAMSESFVKKQEFQDAWNRKMGTNTKVTAETVLAPIRHKYQVLVDRITEDSRERQLMASEQKLERKQKFIANAKAMRLKNGGHQIKFKN